MCKSGLIKKKKPAWLKKSLPKGGDYQRVTRLLSRANLHTVCQEASCPNMFECFSKNTSTFMILGDQCTRHCRFCNVTAGEPLKVDPGEPANVAKAVKELGLDYVVITSVTRDDLPDGGADHFGEVIHAVQQVGEDLNKKIQIEVLIPDFNGDPAALQKVIQAGPDVINHNIETVAELYFRVRPEAEYYRSLELLRNVRALSKKIKTKSGIMVGLGETKEQLIKTMHDLHEYGCQILTVGQYLQPSRQHLEVEKFYTPQEFEQLDTIARDIGFNQVASGAFVRSSYNAKELFVC